MGNIYSYIPNGITILRLLLTGPVIFFIINADYFVALVLFTACGLSDALDGFLARRNGWESAFGKLIDPLADKFMMIATSLTLGLLDLFPLTLMVLIIAKDVAILVGVFSYTALAGFPDVQPTRLGKITTAFQITLLATVLFDLSWPAFLASFFLESWFWLLYFWIVAILTSLDGVSYLWVWTRRLVQDPRRKDSSHIDSEHQGEDSVPSRNER